MDNKREREIKNKAKEINHLSENFQLIHATYATQEYIKDIAKEYYSERIDALKIRIKEKIEKDMDAAQELEEKEELEVIIRRNLFYVDIGFINISNEMAARVVKNNKSFTIYLAASLRDNIFTEKGEFNYKVIATIRKLMSHELGHLVLHTKDILQDNTTQGSLNIKDAEKEQEANIFGQELIELRKERNKKIRKDGGAEILF